DLDQAVEGALLAKFRNVGQACTAGNRFLVHESVAEAFSKKIVERVRAMNVGDGTDPDVTIGPLINQSAVESMVELLDDAVTHGAEILTGGNSVDSVGHFIEPT